MWILLANLISFILSQNPSKHQILSRNDPLNIPRVGSNVEKLLKLRSKSIWIVIRSTRGKDGQSREDFIKQNFPGWYFPKLEYPLRTTKMISEKVKITDETFGMLNNDFNRSIEIPEHMPLGTF